MMHFIDQILDARPHRLTLVFNTGEVRVVDLEPILQANATSFDSPYRQLLDPAIFCKVRLDQESRTVCWDGLARMLDVDGIEKPAPLDFCPDTLYQMSVAESPQANRPWRT